MENAELSIVEIVCKLEKIFPPAFFNVMEHLVVHLPYEAKVGGPVQYRWMYPFERCMLYLKRKARNKARVEGSICEAYNLEEVSNFASMYFDPKLQTRHTKVPRNDDGGQCMIDECLSIFKYPCRPIGKGKKRFLTDGEYQIAETYVLVNCKEVEPFLQQFEDSLRQSNLGITDDQILELRDRDFSRWIQQQVSDGQVKDQLIRQMSYGPLKSVTCYNGIIVNGYRFHTKQNGQNKATNNSGVCVRGSIYGEHDIDYYGIIEEILELSYIGAQNKVLLLRCHWFDPINGVKVDERYGLVDVKPKSRLNSNEPFVLASQAQQVYYTMYPQSNVRGSSDWWAACKVRRKLFVAESFNDEQLDLNELDASDYYQDDGSFGTSNVVIEDEEFSLFDANSPMEDVDINDIHKSKSAPLTDQFIDDNEYSVNNEYLDEDVDKQ
ncbi:uncharacterized protein LOC123903770 [Trifolium pratense]|nr:uncharacterized protein LOC123903770 [Trifolium pratense]